MKLTFLGANHEVTGSCTLLEAAGQRYLIDCGMEQGKDTYENQPIPVAPGEIDGVLATHAHIDHTGLLPLLAYNYSAENHERRHRIFLCGCAVAVGFSVVCVAGYEVFAPALVRIFIGDAQTIACGTKLLRIMVLAMPMMSVCYPMITQFQAMGRMRESLICSILRKGSLDIPLLFVLNALFPLYGCAAVQPIVDCICMIVAIYFYKKLPTA